MSKRKELVSFVLQKSKSLLKEKGSAFAPVNIALVKYWGKRDQELNLPMTNSLSFTLSVGTTTTVSINTTADSVWLNDKPLSLDTPFSRRLIEFCDLFRPNTTTYFDVKTTNDIPTGAGLASSASGFAALTLALNDLFSWNLDKKNLSLLARMGSGSACRSLFDGFVEWHAGSMVNGTDSFAERLDVDWPDLRLGLWILSTEQKPIDSRQAMQSTVEHSSLYASWPAKVAQDLLSLKQALFSHDFALLGQTSENNALAMHATMIASWPPIVYWLEESLKAMRQVWQWRKEGLQVYFTMDAGPNIKLLFLEKDRETIRKLLPTLKII